MANMSYCQFQNTAGDLHDCLFRLRDLDGDVSELSEDERAAALQLVDFCEEIVADFLSTVRETAS